MQGNRDAIVEDLLFNSARAGLSLRSRPIPAKHCSALASIEWFPATGRDWRSCCCSWSLGTGRRVIQRSREKRRQACRRGSWLLKRRRPWRVQKTFALALDVRRTSGLHVDETLRNLLRSQKNNGTCHHQTDPRLSQVCYRRGQRRSHHRTSKVCPFLFLFSRRLSVPRFILNCEAASLRALLSVARGSTSGCRQGDPPLDPIPFFLPLVFVKIEIFHALPLATSVRRSLFE